MSQFSNFDDKWRPDRPYDELPGLPPSAELETKIVLKRCVTARAAVAELRQSLVLIPNPGILLDTLPVLEAQASSEIENIVTTADQLFRHSRTEQVADPATREALRYRASLLNGFIELRERPTGVKVAETVCSEIKGFQMSVRRVPGIALKQQSTDEVVYTPPESGERLRQLLSNWERYLHDESEIDPLIRMAVAHYQFEAIHPFTDGNGRTGRILNILFLVEQGLVSLPILQLSRYLVARRLDYYRLLLGVTKERDWESWVLFMLSAVEQTAQFTTAKIGAMRRLEEETSTHIRRANSKIYSRELVEVIFRQPYCRIANLVDAGVCKRQAASRYLQALVKIGVLTENPVGREKLFVHPKLLGLLTRDRNDFVSYAR